MVEELARTFRVNPTTFAFFAASTLVVAALVAGFILNRVLHHWTKKHQSTWGELFFSLLESLPLPLLSLGALYAALNLFTLPARFEQMGSRLIFALTILVVFYFPAKGVIVALRRASRSDPSLERITNPATFVVRALFALLATIIVLENLGVSLTAVWTTLGVGSVAVALALQDTLGNFFSGLYLLADRPVTAGDFIRIDSGQEGFVVRIGWRSTTLRTLPNNLVVIPNSTLAKSIITNYSAPEPRMALVMPVSVAYGTDPGRVEEVLGEVAEQAIRDGLEGLRADPAPVVRFMPGFGPSSLDFSLIVQVRQFTDQFPVQSELRKRIVERFRKEGIEIPFPTRTVLLSGPGPNPQSTSKPNP